jgi:hypothetical protein
MTWGGCRVGGSTFVPATAEVLTGISSVSAAGASIEGASTATLGPTD